jgi:hypothetical protein
VLVGARKAAKNMGKIGEICAFWGKRREVGRRAWSEGGAPGHDSCPCSAAVAVDSFQHLLRSESLLTDSKILW